MRQLGYTLLFTVLIGWVVLRYIRLSVPDQQTVGITPDQMREEFQRFRDEIDARLVPLEDAVEALNA